MNALEKAKQDLIDNNPSGGWLAKSKVFLHFDAISQELGIDCWHPSWNGKEKYLPFGQVERALKEIENSTTWG